MSYDGYSMSINARIAYDNGEKPLSKWSKADILSAVSVISPEKAAVLKAVSAASLKAGLLIRSSWHHTSCRYNKTVFYMLDDDLVESSSPEDLLRICKSQEPDKEVKKAITFRGTIHYIEWAGSLRHPIAHKCKLENVIIEEKGCFYIVSDDKGNILLKKKIDSNGTWVERN